MAKSSSQAVGFGLLLLLGGPVAGCDAPEKGDSGDEPTAEKRSAAHDVVVPAVRRVPDGLLRPRRWRSAISTATVATTSRC